MSQRERPFITWLQGKILFYSDERMLTCVSEEESLHWTVSYFQLFLIIKN